MPILNDARERAIEIKCIQRLRLGGQPIEYTFAWSAEHVLHQCAHRLPPEACPTCFITRMRRRSRAASMSILPAQRYTLNS